MTTQIILWIVIMFLVLSPAQLLKNGSREGDRHRRHSSETDKNINDIEKFINSEKNSSGHTQINEGKPLEGDPLNNETICSTPCVNGFCVEPNICECHYGWNGTSCDKRLVCFVALPLRKPAGPRRNLSEITTRLIQRTEHACLPKCVDQVINSTDFVSGRTLGKKTYYFVPIHAECNTEGLFWVILNKYSFEIGLGIGIVLVILVICIIYLVPRKRKTADTVNDIPTQYGSSEYMEINSIYTRDETVL